MARPVDVVGLLEAGLKAEGLREKTIAGNVANIETPGYKRLDVKFEELLARALRSSNPVDLDAIEPQLVRPGNTPVKSNGNDVDLEQEVGEMLKNTLRQTAYVRLLRKKFAQIETAVNTGG